MSASEHPSAFELDVYFASREGERETAPAAAHVASCARCRAYLDALDALSSGQPVERRAARAPKLRRVLASTATVLALAAGIALLVRSRGPSKEAAYIGVKGAPAAQVLVRSGSDVRVWDGVSPVRAGDALALRVACEQFAYATVISESGDGIVRPWEGPCASPPAALPFTLVVDAQPGREHFAVVLSHERLDDRALRASIRASQRGDELWVMAFDFEKEEMR